MKVLQLTTTVLSDSEFNELSDQIADSLYSLVDGLRDFYDIHINYINDSWAVDFVPLNNHIPALNVSTYTTYDSHDVEVLHITPMEFVKFPTSMKFRNYNNTQDMATMYAIVFDFVVSLYDFEFPLGH